MKCYSFGPQVCRWIERNCVLPTGEDIGAPFVLLPWQREFIWDLYSCDRNGEQVYRWALLGVPKGNGKSPLLAALGLYDLVGDPSEVDPWVVCSATSSKQADIIFGAARAMADMSPTLRDQTIRYTWEIRAKDGPGKIERVAASKGKLDGKLPSLLLIDELHEWDLANWTILTGGAMKRRKSRIVQATTAGYDLDTVCGREYEKGERMRSGELVNPTYLYRWYGAAKGDDYRDPAIWAKANPSYGTLVHQANLEALRENVTESVFRRYRLNQWTESEETWIASEEWAACRVDAFDLEDDALTVLGWDASTKHDSTGIVQAQPRTCEAGKTHIRVKATVWERPVHGDGSPVLEWRVPMAEVVAVVRDSHRRFNLDAVAYDPAYISWEADELDAQGVPMVEWPQSPARMIPATQSLYEAIASPCECGARRLEHDGDPTLARHMASVKARPMRGGGLMLEKRSRGRPIDLAVALLMAVGLVVGMEAVSEARVFSFGGVQ